MINSPTRFMTASMREASTRTVLSATAATAEDRGTALVADGFRGLGGFASDLGGLRFQNIAQEVRVRRISA